jgi:hypothetical protein
MPISKKGEWVNLNEGVEEEGSEFDVCFEMMYII